MVERRPFPPVQGCVGAAALGLSKPAQFGRLCAVTATLN